MPNEISPPLDNGRYRIFAVLGRGGLATVYRARDTRKNVDRAIKVLAHERASDAILRKRFFREAQTMAMLDHPHIVRVHDLGEEDGRLYMVMELMAGSSVARGLRRFGALPEVHVASVLIQVLSGLQHAHDQGVIHRDVKPGNVLLDARGVPKLSDFGIARIEERTALTATGAVMGSWPYMGPEQRASARDVDERSDVFSCGAMLYAMARNAEPKDIYVPQQREVLLRGFSPALSDVITKATQRDLGNRYASAGAMRDALMAVEDMLQKTPVVAETSGLRGSHTFHVEE